MLPFLIAKLTSAKRRFYPSNAVAHVGHRHAHPVRVMCKGARRGLRKGLPEPILRTKKASWPMGMCASSYKFDSIHGAKKVMPRKTH